MHGRCDAGDGIGSLLNWLLGWIVLCFVGLEEMMAGLFAIERRRDYVLLFAVKIR